MPSSEFTRIVRDLSQLGESVRIEEKDDDDEEDEEEDGEKEGGDEAEDGDTKEKKKVKKEKVKKEEKGEDVEMDDEEKGEEEFKPKSDDEGEDEQDDDDDDDESSKKRKKHSKVSFPAFFSMFQSPASRHITLSALLLTFCLLRHAPYFLSFCPISIPSGKLITKYHHTPRQTAKNLPKKPRQPAHPNPRNRPKK
jgi:hypothetical protein